MAEADDKAKRVPAGSLLMSFKLTIGRVAFPNVDVFPNEAIVHIEPEPDGPVTREYLALWLGSRDLTAGSGRAVKGNTLNGKSLRAIPVSLPPLPVQRRIVDVMEHLDNQVDRLHAEAQAARELLRPLLVSLVENSEDVTWVPLGDVGEFIRGRRFTKRDYVPSGLGCIHYGQVHTHFGYIATESVTFLPDGLRSRLRVAKPGDVVVAAASEDIDGLGKATVWMGDEDVAVHDDCFIFRHSLDPRFASFLFDSPWFHSQKRKYASGMKVARILGDNLARIEVPVPSAETQAQAGDALSRLIAEAEALQAEEVALRRLRASLLTNLLSGQHTVPESYDELLGVAS